MGILLSLSSLQSIFFFFFFIFTLVFTLYILNLKLWCNCKICQAYLTSSWTSDFDNLCDWYTHLLQNSPTKTIHIHVLRNTITANPKNVEHILKTKFHNYPKGKQFSTILGDLLGRGIFNIDGDSWMFQRKMASLELGSISTRTFAFEIITNEIHSRLVPFLSENLRKQNDNVLDLQDVFRRFSFDTICKFSFGLDPGCLKLSLPICEFQVAFDSASRLSAERGLASLPLVWKTKRYLNLGSEKALKESLEMVNNLALEMINQRRKLGFSNRNDLLSRFMGSINDEKYLRDIVISFLLAGRDTVASGLTSFFWLLSKHQATESLILNELDRVMGQDQAMVNYDQLRDMQYLHAAIYESLRLFPPVQFDSKFSLDDDILPDGTFVTKGTRVTYHPYAMARMDHIWGSDCMEFKPERWLKDGLFVPENSYKYPVFQAGLRVCLGKEMAILEMKCVVVALIREFIIRVENPDELVRFSPGLTATIKGGLPVSIIKRGLAGC